MVLTVIRNLKTVLTDPANGLISAIVQRMDQIQEKYKKQHINLVIQSTTFLSCSDSCANLLRVFDEENYLTTRGELYQKMKSDYRTSTIQRHTESRDALSKNDAQDANCIILINPSYESFKTIPICAKVNKEVRIIYTEDHEVSKSSQSKSSQSKSSQSKSQQSKSQQSKTKSALTIAQKICSQMIGDRIQGLKSSDLTITNRRNIGSRERKIDSLGDMINHIVDSIYEAIDRNTQ